MNEFETLLELVFLLLSRFVYPSCVMPNQSVDGGVPDDFRNVGQREALENALCDEGVPQLICRTVSELGLSAPLLRWLTPAINVAEPDSCLTGYL